MNEWVAEAKRKNAARGIAAPQRIRRRVSAPITAGPASGFHPSHVAKAPGRPETAPKPSWTIEALPAGAGTDASATAGPELNAQCELDVQLVWKHSLMSGVQTTPLIESLSPDGRKTIVVPSFARQLSLLSRDGHLLPGYPVPVRGSAVFYASPVVMDFDGDGHRDFVWVSSRAQVFVLGGDPSALPRLLAPPMDIPKLRVRRDWHSGMQADGGAAENTAIAKAAAEAAARASSSPAGAGGAGRRLLSVLAAHAASASGRETTPAWSYAAMRKLQQLTERRRGGRDLDAEADVDVAVEADERAARAVRTEGAPGRRGGGVGAGVGDALLQQYLVDDAQDDEEAADEARVEEAERTLAQGLRERRDAEQLTDEFARKIAGGKRARLVDRGAGKHNKKGEARRRGDDTRGGELESVVSEMDDRDALFARDAENFLPEAGASAGKGAGEGERDGLSQVGDGLTAEGVEALKLLIDPRPDPPVRKRRADGRGEEEDDDDEDPTGEAPDAPEDQLLAEAADVAAAAAAAAQAKASARSGGPRSGSGASPSPPPPPPPRRRRTRHRYAKDADHVWVDAHVLATPTAADVDGDGFPDLILPMSYYFDSADYESPHARARLPADLCLSCYVAGGLVAYSLRKDAVVWTEHLDLTTQQAPNPAFVLGSPTLADLDGDGRLDVVVGTQLGFVYVLDAFTGKVRPNFPLVMGPVEGDVAVEDVNDDGQLELVAVDQRGTVLCFDRKGAVLWSSRVGSATAKGATFGDVDGDGHVDVVIGTMAGEVWALHGYDGKPLEHFPVRAGGRVAAPVTLVNLDPGIQGFLKHSSRAAAASSASSPSAGGGRVDLSLDGQIGVVESASAEQVKRWAAWRRVHGKGLHLVFPAFDGHVYIVDGRSGCTNKIDVGDRITGGVVADDVLGRGRVDLIVATKRGDVLCFSTESPFHSSKAWPRQLRGLNGFSTGVQGVALIDLARGRDVKAPINSGSVVAEGFSALLGSATGLGEEDSALAVRQVSGSEFFLTFAIVDSRLQSFSRVLEIEEQTGARPPPRSYEVVVTSTVELVGGADPDAPSAAGGWQSSWWGPALTALAGAGAQDQGPPREQQVATSEAAPDLSSASGSFRALLPAIAAGHVVLRQTFTEAGVYTVRLPTPHVPARAVVSVHMVNRHGQVFEDTAFVAFHGGFHRALKWFLLLPFAAVVAALVFTRRDDKLA